MARFLGSGHVMCLSGRSNSKFGFYRKMVGVSSHGTMGLQGGGDEPKNTN